MLISRRGLIGGLAGFLAAPAIVRASSLMPVKVVDDAACLVLHNGSAWIPYKVDFVRNIAVWNHRITDPAELMRLTR